MLHRIMQTQLLLAKCDHQSSGGFQSECVGASRAQHKLQHLSCIFITFQFSLPLFLSSPIVSLVAIIQQSPYSRVVILSYKLDFYSR